MQKTELLKTEAVKQYLASQETVEEDFS